LRIEARHSQKLADGGNRPLLRASSCKGKTDHMQVSALGAMQTVKGVLPPTSDLNWPYTRKSPFLIHDTRQRGSNRCRRTHVPWVFDRISARRIINGTATIAAEEFDRVTAPRFLFCGETSRKCGCFPMCTSRIHSPKSSAAEMLHASNSDFAGRSLARHPHNQRYSPLV